MAASISTKATILLLFVGALLCHIYRGDAGDEKEPCQQSDIHISTAATGRIVGGQPEHKVTVDNQCSCPQADVVVSCPDGLTSAEPVDRSKIRVVDNKEGLCLVNNGWQISKGSPVTFTYASSTALEFTLYNATPRCWSPSPSPSI